MSAPRSEPGDLVLGVNDVLQLSDLSEELADGLATLGSFKIGEPVPLEFWRPLARSAARLATLLEGLAAARALRPALH